MKHASWNRHRRQESSRGRVQRSGDRVEVEGGHRIGVADVGKGRNGRAVKGRHRIEARNKLGEACAAELDIK